MTTRNHNIMRLRGCLPGLVGLIPADIKQKMPKEDIDNLKRISGNIMILLNLTARDYAHKRLMKTKSLTKQAKKDIVTITGMWFESDEDYQEMYNLLKGTETCPMV